MTGTRKEELTIDQISRRLAYARQRYGDTPETRKRVMDAIAAGTEGALLTPRQGRRTELKRGHMVNALRQQIAARTAEIAP